MSSRKKKYDPDIHNAARPNVGVTVVPIIYDLNEGILKVLMYRREKDAEQFPSLIALPNGVYDRRVVSTAEEAAENALKEKVLAKIPFMEQLYTFTGNYIDPGRINTVNIAYWSVLRLQDIKVDSDKSDNSFWVPIDEMLKEPESVFAFNHKEVLQMALDRLKSKAEYCPVGIQLLPKYFTIREFKDLTEMLIGQSLNNVRFRDRLKKSNLLIELSGVKKPGVSKSHQLYASNPKFTGFFHPKSIGN